MNAENIKMVKAEQKYWCQDKNLIEASLSWVVVILDPFYVVIYSTGSSGVSFL